MYYLRCFGVMYVTKTTVAAVIPPLLACTARHAVHVHTLHSRNTRSRTEVAFSYNVYTESRPPLTVPCVVDLGAQYPIAMFGMFSYWLLAFAWLCHAPCGIAGWHLTGRVGARLRCYSELTNSQKYLVALHMNSFLILLQPLAWTGLRW